MPKTYRVVAEYEVDAETIQETMTHLRRAGPVDSDGVRVVGMGVEPLPDEQAPWLRTERAPIFSP